MLSSKIKLAIGGGVTPNKFDELVEKADKPGEAKRKRNLLYKQLLTCPFCGKPLTEDEFYIDPDRKSAAIYCADRNCMFYKYKQNRIRIPVYLVDEEIYAKCPTIILSTVDKFARLPFPGLVFTLYNPYRPRDLSHYENFTGYHSQLYRFVEGTTATPFSARARDRVMHALIISAIRLKYPEMASNERAADIAALSDIQMSEIKALILDRLNIVKPEVRLDAENEIDQFIDWWKMLAAQGKPLRYYVYGTDKYNRLMNYYGQSCKDTEKATLSSMREVENAANMFYYTEE